MAKSVANGDFYGRIGAVALLTAESDDDGNYTMKTDDFKDCAFYNGLNFRFRVEYYADDKQGIVGNGSVSILGLGVETIKKWASIDIAEKNRSRLQYIRVYAGYQSDGHVSKCELFTVRCIGALPTPPPDMWLNFTVWNGTAGISDKLLAPQGLFLAGTFVPGAHKGTRSPYATETTYRSTNGISIRDACRKLAKAIASKYGYELKDNPDKTGGEPEDQFLNWYVSPELEKRLPRLRAVDWACKTPEEAVEIINSWGVVRAYFEDYEETVSETDWLEVSAQIGINVLKAAVPGGGLLGATPIGDGQHDRKMWHPVLIVKPNFADYKYDTSIKDPFEISQDTGMVGLPHVSEKNGGNQVVVKCLLRRDIGIGDLIKISSKYVKLPYEYYQVNKIAYEGEFRGQPWYVTYTAVSAKSEEERNEEERKKKEKQAEADKKQKQDSNKVIKGPAGLQVKAPPDKNNLNGFFDPGMAF